MILEIIETKKDYSKLCDFTKDTKANACQHLKRIMAQMPGYDLHDADHSKAVLHNIEELLGEKSLSKLTTCELILLYLSAYMHDTGMALPDWELKILEAIDSEENKVNNWINDFRNEFKRPFKLSKSQTLIRKHANSIFGSCK
jgi:molecular chaperone HtpG